MTLSSRCFFRLITLSEIRLSKTRSSPCALGKATPNNFPRAAACQALALFGAIYARSHDGRTFAVVSAPARAWASAGAPRFANYCLTHVAREAPADSSVRAALAARGSRAGGLARPVLVQGQLLVHARLDLHAHLHAVRDDGGAQLRAHAPDR